MGAVVALGVGFKHRHTQADKN
ncbi:hypothetical protein [Microcystis aeruginosa]|nr:hypothetical protein [Microcystis aeruginosa]